MTLTERYKQQEEMRQKAKMLDSIQAQADMERIAMRGYQAGAASMQNAVGPNMGLSQALNGRDELADRLGRVPLEQSVPVIEDGLSKSLISQDEAAAMYKGKMDEDRASREYMNRLDNRQANVGYTNFDESM